VRCEDKTRIPTQSELSSILEKDVIKRFMYTIENWASNIKIIKVVGHEVYFKISKSLYDREGLDSFRSVDDDGNHPTRDGCLFVAHVKK
jgi:hypothetical protein